MFIQCLSTSLWLSIIAISFTACGKEEVQIPRLVEDSTEFRFCDFECLRQEIPAAFPSENEFIFTDSLGHEERFVFTRQFDWLEAKCPREGDGYPLFVYSNVVDTSIKLSITLDQHIYVDNCDSIVSSASFVLFSFTTWSIGIPLDINNARNHENQLLIIDANTGQPIQSFPEFTLVGRTFSDVHVQRRLDGPYRALYVTPDHGIIGYKDRRGVRYVLKEG